jgi:hypothetical protein
MIDTRQIATLITEDPDIFNEDLSRLVIPLLPSNIGNLYGQNPKVTYKIDEIISLAEKTNNLDPEAIAREIIETLRNSAGDYPPGHKHHLGVQI